MKRRVKKISKNNKKCVIFYLIAGTLFLIGAVRFYFNKDDVGTIINALAGLSFLLASYLNYK